MEGVAQLASASDCGSEGRGFDSHRPPQKKTQDYDNSESFSIKSAFCGINPLSWMKSLRDEILLRKVIKRRI